MRQQPISKVTEHRQGLFQRNTRSIHLITLRAASLRPRTMEKGLGEAPSELAQDRRAWSAFVRDVAISIGDAGSTYPGRSRRKYR